MSAPIPGPALECPDCGETISVTEEEQRRGDCPVCGEFAIAVTLVICPTGEDGDQCADDNHDFGLGMHVIEVSP